MTLYDGGLTSHVRKGTLKLAIVNANAGANGIASVGIENPEDEVILIDRVVADVKTAAEAASNILVGVGDNASDNVVAGHVQLINTNAMALGAVVGTPTANVNCKVAAKGATANAFVMAGVSVAANADNLVADVYVDYIIP